MVQGGVPADVILEEHRATNTGENVILSLPIIASMLAFEIAARAAFREALQKADPVLLEPIVNAEITSPADCIKAVIDDLNLRRRAQIQERDIRGEDAISAHWCRS